MRIKVSEDGIHIPREMLPDAAEVEVEQANGTLVVRPINDPALSLGEAPVPCGAPDASEQHDRHLYGSDA